MHLLLLYSIDTTTHPKMSQRHQLFLGPHGDLSVVSDDVTFHVTPKALHLHHELVAAIVDSHGCWYHPLPLNHQSSGGQVVAGNSNSDKGGGGREGQAGGSPYGGREGGW